jgi:transposase
MYLKVINKYCKAENKSVCYYRLCESYRDALGIVRQKMIISLGRLSELEGQQRKLLLCERLNDLIRGEPGLFTGHDHQVEDLAQHYYRQVLSKQKVDKKLRREEALELVKMKTLKNRDVREIGAESLCYQAFKQLGMGKYLASRGWSGQEISLAATQIVSRAVYPASELKTVSWIKENSAVCELTGYDHKLLTKDKLYQMAKRLYQEKQGFENHLSRCTNELFNLDDKVILYDLTNTYFEGRMQGSRLARFGRSKEKRSDARLIVLALIVNPEGFLKYSDIFEGNTTDHSTLGAVIEKLNAQGQYPGRKPTVVMDAGISTEDNLAFLKAQGYPYMCVSRSNLNEYKAQTGKEPVQVHDKRNQPIELLRVQPRQDGDNYLWVRSQAKAQKEHSMNRLFTERFEEGLRGIHNGVIKKGGTKKLQKVWERIGRLKEKYPSVHPYYQISVSDNGQGIATALSFEQNQKMPTEQNAGVYFLRTSLDWQDEQTMWKIYNAIREIEYTFRVLKTDLDLRPIFHKTDDASMAHLHLGLLAYWLVATIRYQLKMKGYTHNWQEIVRTMNTQKMVTTSAENDKGDIISIRQCSEPTHAVNTIYLNLNYNSIPLQRKKSVWHTADKIKNTIADYQYINDT